MKEESESSKRVREATESYLSYSIGKKFIEEEFGDACAKCYHHHPYTDEACVSCGCEANLK